jgi:hypothetical protein
VAAVTADARRRVVYVAAALAVPVIAALAWLLPDPDGETRPGREFRPVGLDMTLSCAEFPAYVAHVRGEVEAKRDRELLDTFNRWATIAAVQYDKECR